jgi:transposase
VAEVADALGISERTIERLKHRFVENGLEAALEAKERSAPAKLVFDGRFEARLIALACSPAPEGRVRWTMRLLAQRVVELQIAPAVSLMTIQRTLKKTRCSLT